MKKPAALRAALRSAVDHLRDNPEQMHVFIDDGTVVSTGVPGLAWEYRYTLNIVITEFTGDQNLIIAPVLAWLAENQPEDLQHPQKREKLFRFEADILGNDRCDLSIELSLTEIVTSAPQGSNTVISTQPEPQNPDDSWDEAGWTVHRG